jgi:hypothetical protein
LDMMCTSMTTGEACAFDAAGFSLWREKPDRSSERITVAAPGLPVSLAVAASSAFPPLFPPLRIDHKILKCDVSQFPHGHYVADGGIFDNIGIEQFRSTSDVDLVIVSDAEGNFDWVLDSPYTSLVARNVRASDMLMKRVSALEYDKASAIGGRYVRCGIGPELTVDEAPDGLDAELQRAIRNMRTDLDSFSDDEIYALMTHGSTVARVRLAQSSPAVQSGSNARQRASADGSRRRISLAGCENRRYRIWSARDWASWATVLVLALYSSAAVVPIILHNQELERQRRTAALRQWRPIDLVRDGTTEYAFLQRVPRSAAYRTNPQFGRFDESELFIAGISNDDVRCVPLTDGLFLPRWTPAGAMRVDPDLIRVFFIAKPNEKLDYAVDGVTFGIDKQTLSAVTSVALFHEENWGWFPRYEDAQHVIHFGYDYYTQMSNTTTVSRTTADVMTAAHDAWLRTHSGGKLPTTGDLDSILSRTTTDRLLASCQTPSGPAKR